MKNKSMIILFSTCVSVGTYFIIRTFIETMLNPKCGSYTYYHDGMCELFGIYELTWIMLLILTIFSSGMLIIVLNQNKKGSVSWEKRD